MLRIPFEETVYPCHATDCALHKFSREKETKGGNNNEQKILPEWLECLAHAPLKLMSLMTTGNRIR